MPRVEIRVPTYRRPHLLERALRSLIAQTEAKWVALVIDDSPNQEGRRIVERLGDSRIQYYPNLNHLGCAGNLDHAFDGRSYAGADYASVLEDDNWYLPELIASNLRMLNSSDHNILLRNQAICPESLDAAPVLAGRTTRGGIFEEGEISPMKLRASLFFCEGVSNGGLFWRTTAANALQVGPEVSKSSLQEYCRSLLIREPILFASEPLAVFSVPVQGHTRRELLSNRVFNRGRQSIWRRLLAFHDSELMEEARQMARTPQMRSRLTFALLDALSIRHISPSDAGFKQVLQVTKGLAKIVRLRDPLDLFWKNKGDLVFSPT